MTTKPQRPAPDATDHSTVVQALRNPRQIPVPVLLAGGLAVIVLIAVAVAATTSGAAFGAYNPEWDGTTEFYDALEDDPSTEVTVAQHTDHYTTSDPESTVAFVIAPDEPYGDAERAHLEQFLEDGGTLVVLENFGPHGNDLLDQLDTEARFDGQLVLDESTYAESPAMPIATAVESHALTADVEQLSLNYATAIEPGEATVLVSTTENSYFGANASAGPGDADELSAKPVATVESVGEGSVIAVSDPSITINAMYGESDNDQFLTNLYTTHERAIIDVSHTEVVPPLTAMVLTLRESLLLQALLGGVGIGVVAAYMTGATALWRRALSRADSGSDPAIPTLSEAELTAAIEHHHPEWDDDSISEVIGAFKQPETKQGDET